VGVGQVERLLEIYTNIFLFLFTLVAGTADPVFIDVLEQVGVDEVDLIVLARSRESHDAGVAGVVHFLSLDLKVPVVLRLRDWVDIGKIVS
jgi:hypothetical protein